MTKKVLLILISILLIFQPITYAEPSITSGSAILIESETGQILFEYNSNAKKYPASITKVLTAIIAMEETKLDEIVIVSDDVPDQIERGSSQIYLLPGEKLTMEQLLYALLVESANDAAVTIAEHISGSVTEFAKLMNNKAKELGATNSNFVNPNGLHDDNHYLTAYDMSLIMKEAIKYPTLLNIMSTVTYTIPATDKQDTRYLWTKNKLLKSPSNPYFYDNVIASKTGFTSKARNTLVVAAEENNMKLITVVLSAEGNLSYSDTLDMFEYGFNNFKSISIIGKDDFIEDYNLENAKSPLKLIASNDLTYIGKINENYNFIHNITISEDLSLPIEKGQKVGTLTYTLESTVIGEVDLVAGNKIKSNYYFLWIKLKSIIIWSLCGLFLLYIIARIYVAKKNAHIRRRKYKRYRKKSKRSEYSRF